MVKKTIVCNPQDYDNDGWPEIFIVGDFAGSKMFWNNKNGTFTECTMGCGINGMEVFCCLLLLFFLLRCCFIVPTHQRITKYFPGLEYLPNPEPLISSGNKIEI